MFDPIVIAQGENVYVIKYTGAEKGDFGRTMHWCSIDQVVGEPPVSSMYRPFISGNGGEDPSHVIWSALGNVGQYLAAHNEDGKEAVK